MTEALLLPPDVYAICGFLSQAEAELLYTLAAQVPKNGIIIEIGSYQGKSTVCLGLGAKQSGAWVYAVDPHEDKQETETTHYGMENHAALLKNLLNFGVADVVRVVALPSEVMPRYPMDLLWIDGCHEYHAVKLDFDRFSRAAARHTIIALHDTAGHFPGVTQALNEILAAGQWKIERQVDATAVLVRA